MARREQQGNVSMAQPVPADMPQASTLESIGQNLVGRTVRIGSAVATPENEVMVGRAAGQPVLSEASGKGGADGDPWTFTSARVSPSTSPLRAPVWTAVASMSRSHHLEGWVASKVRVRCRHHAPWI
jgi:hypothetical protein